MRRVLVLLFVVLAATLAYATPSRAGNVEVVIDSTLRPAEVRVGAGSRVTWRNADDERHRVRTESGPEDFDSGNIEPGGTFTVTLSAPGTYRYVDDRDRDNRAYWGSVVVEPSGGSGPPPATGSPPPVEGDPGGGAGSPSAPPAPSSASVGMAGRTFNPATVRVAAGGNVSWNNDDDRAHTVTARDGRFDSGLLSPGQAFAQAFPTAGTFAYFCSVHPEMQGTVEVAAASGAVPPAASGGGSSAAPAAPGGSAGATAPSGAGTAPRPPNGSAPAASVPTTGSVAIADFSFDPPTVTVASGGTVTWKNAGVAPHTATATDGSFDSGMLQTGGTYAHRFERAGTFAYQCNLHPQMRGTVRVVEPGAADAGAGGTADGASADGPASGVTAAAGSPPGRSEVAAGDLATRSASSRSGVVGVIASGLAGIGLGACFYANRRRLARLIRRR